jgi:hypothetical protein
LHRVLLIQRYVNAQPLACLRELDRIREEFEQL